MSKNLVDVIDVKHLTYKVLSNYSCEKLLTAEGEIELKNSWLDAILMMLSAIINGASNYRKDFMKVNLLNSRFVVDEHFGMCNPEEEVRTYKIPDTAMYLELVYRVDVVKEALVKLVKILGTENKIRFRLKNLDVSQSEIKNVRTEHFVNGDNLVKLTDLGEFVDEQYEIKAVFFGNNEVQVESDMLAMYLILRQVVTKQELLNQVKERRIGNTGICLVGDDIAGISKQPLNEIYAVFTDGNRKDIYEFLSLLGGCGIRLMVRDTKNYIKPEWEID